MANYGSFDNLHTLREYARRKKFSHLRIEIEDGGWHYSYLTGFNPEKIREKVRSFVEPDSTYYVIGDNENIAKNIKNKTDLYGRKGWANEAKIIDINDEYWKTNQPKNLKKFVEKYPHFIWEE